METMMTTGDELIYRPEMMDPTLPTGLWWCKDAEDVGAVNINAVCKSLLAPWSALRNSAEFAEQYPYILVAVPPGMEQDTVSAELLERFGVPILVPKAHAFRGHRSMREFVDEEGLDALNGLLLGAEELPAPGLLNLADVPLKSQWDGKRTLSGIRELDRAIGGFTPGALSVWTGKRGEGKSTLLGQILLDAVNQGHKCCAYSGELPKEQFKSGLMQQAAGYLNVDRRDDPRSDKTVYEVKPEVIPAIDSWWDKCLFLTDIQRKDAHDEDNILRIFEYANRRYGCDTFLVDNIMTAELKQEASIGFWRAQSAFTGRLAAFSKRVGVHVHLVAHPRKTDAKRHIEADDVGGSVDITNRADNVFLVERVPEEELQKAGYSARLTVLKNREFGSRAKVKLDYNEASRRLYPANGSPAKRYSWEMAR